MKYSNYAEYFGWKYYSNDKISHWLKKTATTINRFFYSRNGFKPSIKKNRKYIFIKKMITLNSLFI